MKTSQRLDTLVLIVIQNNLEEQWKLSIRKISRILWMEKSLRSVQLSIDRLKKSWKIFTSQKWILPLDKLGFKEKFNWRFGGLYNESQFKLEWDRKPYPRNEEIIDFVLKELFNN